MIGFHPPIILICMRLIFLTVFLIVLTLGQDQTTLKDLFSQPEFIAAREEHERRYAQLKTEQPKIDFNCPRVPRQSPVPTNARNLRPSDIKVVMALGDSISAGFAMVDNSYVTSVHEYRGKSGFMGVDNATASLGRYFEKVGGNVKGGSVGRGLPWSAQPWGIRPNNPLVDHLNAAQSNSRIEHIDYQVNYLIKQIKLEPGVDVNKDWKHLNVLMGANNMCHCDYETSRPSNYENVLRAALNKIQANIPRVFVSLIPIFEAGFNDVWRNGKSSTYCRVFWKIFGCPCMVDYDAARAKAVALAKEYNLVLLKIANEFKTRNVEDFHVTLQPMIRHLELEDLSFTSKFDCFHPSIFANEVISVNMWNSIQLPYERKPTRYVKPLRPICPTEATRLQ
jgi:hypothetical protein